MCYITSFAWFFFLYQLPLGREYLHQRRVKNGETREHFTVRSRRGDMIAWNGFAGKGYLRQIFERRYSELFSGMDWQGSGAGVKVK